MSSIKQSAKQRVAKQFGRAAHRYDEAAQVQLDIAFDALQLLGKNALGTTLDIGCGTGRVSRQIAPQTSLLLALDLAEGMVRFAAESASSVSWINGDAEHLPIADNSIDTIFSSMALQWCMPIDRALNEIHRVLKPGGRAVLALMTDGSMSELAQSWRAIDSAPHVNNFIPHADLLNTVKRVGFDFSASQNRYTTWHHTAKEVLTSIKAIGANVLPESGNASKLNRDVLKKLEHAYRRGFERQNQLPLGYQVTFLDMTALSANDLG